MNVSRSVRKGFVDVNMEGTVDNECVFLTSALVGGGGGGGWSASRPGRFTPGTHRIGG
jgi:hypothetical protein